MLLNVKELYGLLGLKKVPLKKRESCMITGFSLFMMPEQSGKLILFFDLQMVFFLQCCHSCIPIWLLGFYGNTLPFRSHQGVCDTPLQEMNARIS